MEIHDDTWLTMVVHGDSKVGKTTFGATSPTPILFLDAEAGGMRFVKGKKKTWDPLEEGIPDMEGYDICRVNLKNSNVLDNVVQYIQMGNHPFVSIVFDSVTDYQERLKKEINTSGSLDFLDWGKVYRNISDSVKALGDCTSEQKQLLSFVIISGTVQRNGKTRPMLQGAMKDRLSYMLDATGYLFVAVNENEEPVRGLRIIADFQTDAGNRFPGDSWPTVIWNPNVKSILENINKEIGEL